MTLPTIKLKHVARSPLKNGLGLPGGHSNENDPRYIRITDIATERTLRHDTYASQPADLAAQATVVRNDILMAAVGATVGKSYLHMSNEDSCFAGYLARFRPNLNKVDPRFVSYWTMSNHYWDQIKTGLVSSTIENFSASKYAAMLIPDWPLALQKRISNYLDQETTEIDAFIADQEELVRLMAERRSATITRAVTQGIISDTPLRDSGIEWLGEIPSHWLVNRFGRCVTINSGQVDPREDPYRTMYLIAPNHVESGTGKLVYLETAEDQGADSGKYPVREGQVIYSKIRPNLMKVVIAPMDCICSADMYGLTADQHQLNNEFLQCILLSRPFHDYAVDQSMRVAMPKLNHETLKAAPVWFPPITEQEAILRYLHDELPRIDAAMVDAQESIDLSRERRAALISAAVTGKIDVRNWDKTTERVIESHGAA